MNHIRIALVVALFLGTTAALTYAQEPETEPKPPKQEEPRAPRQDEAKPEKQEAPKPSKEQYKPAQAEKGQHAQGEHARPAGKSAHIPDQKFKASFGRQHTFAVKQVINTTTVVAGQTQFVYSGYTFVIIDPWPSVWLFTDDCYVDYVDGEYFLFDVLHPGIRIAVFVQG